MFPCFTIYGPRKDLPVDADFSREVLKLFSFFVAMFRRNDDAWREFGIKISNPINAILSRKDGEVFPAPSENNGANANRCYSKFFPKIRGCFSACMSLPYGFDLWRRKFAGWMKFPANPKHRIKLSRHARGTALGHHVVRIVLNGAKEKMIRVAARGIVTFMEHVKAIWNFRVVCQLPSHTMSASGFASECDASILSIPKGPSGPTLVRSFFMDKVIPEVVRIVIVPLLRSHIFNTVPRLFGGVNSLIYRTVP